MSLRPPTAGTASDTARIAPSAASAFEGWPGPEELRRRRLPAPPAARSRTIGRVRLVSSDDRWAASGPVCSAAESFLAGTASCRIEVANIDACSPSCRHRMCFMTSRVGGVNPTDFGAREFATLDSTATF